MNSRKFVYSLAGLFFLVGSAFAEKSMWQKFKDFFNPGETIDCESGPTCITLKELESKINTVEGKYSRERRPVNKSRYKKELDSLNVVRDSLVVVLKNEQSGASSSSRTMVSVESSSSVASSASASSASASKVLSANEVAALVCKPDTVFVRDTVVVHDTLFVVVTNKPEEPPASSSTNP